MDKLDHPCKQTCSGWHQGKESARQHDKKSYLESVEHLRQFAKLLIQSEDDIQKADASTMLDQLESIEITVEENCL